MAKIYLKKVHVKYHNEYCNNCFFFRTGGDCDAYKYSMELRSKCILESIIYKQVKPRKKIYLKKVKGDCSDCFFRERFTECYEHDCIGIIYKRVNILPSTIKEQLKELNNGLALLKMSIACGADEITLQGHRTFYSAITNLLNLISKELIK